MRLRLPFFVEGFTAQVRHYMRLSDFFIGKPGPGSISEALVMGLPVIVQCDNWTLPQERFNARWIAQKEVGMTIRNFRNIRAAVRNLLHPMAFARYRANVVKLRNRAVFEVPDILERILRNARGRRLTDPAEASSHLEESHAAESCGMEI